MKKLSVYTLIPPLLLMLTSIGVVAKNTQPTTKIRKLSTQINELKQRLSNAKDKKATIIEELRSTEVAIGKQSVNLKNTSSDLLKQQTILKKLKADEESQQGLLQSHQNLLSQTLRSAYQLGNHDYLKLLLNQQDPNTMGRMMIYYSYINRERINIIKQLDSTLQKVHENKIAIESHTEQLKVLVKQQNQEKQQLEQKKSYRTKIIAALSQDIQSKQQKIGELTKNKMALERVLVKLNKKKSMTAAKRPFSRMKGKLPWPVLGKITYEFAAPVADSTLKYNGVFIKAKEGLAISAIYPGKVVFANWLRGFGLLIIIEHADGYMTLYAHNHSLYKTLGESVQAGDVVASVGHSGGNWQNGLYFEIRHNAKLINPQQWCT